jgi:hypothetical protein
VQGNDRENTTQVFDIMRLMANGFVSRLDDQTQFSRVKGSGPLRRLGGRGFGRACLHGTVLGGIAPRDRVACLRFRKHGVPGATSTPGHAYADVRIPLDRGRWGFSTSRAAIPLGTSLPLPRALRDGACEMQRTKPTANSV